MDEVSRTEEGYAIAISDVLSYIQVHLDEELTPQRLAEVACFSLYHFHRIFRAVVGEPVMDHVRRLRLERAAYRLKTSQASVASIALDAGYGAQEAFTRTFQAHYGLAPRPFRRVHATHLLPAVSGVHFAPNGFTPLRRAYDPDLLEQKGLCPAHLHMSYEFEEKWEEGLEVITGFASLVYPRFGGRYPRELEELMKESTMDIDREIETLQGEIEAAKQRLTDAQKRRPKEPVVDYVLRNGEDQDVRLSELFGDKRDLILIHNMGTSCSYCTMWADGFTGLAPHLSDRAAFVVCSPDIPEVQKRFAAKRNWHFTMVSAHASPFIKDMGFWKDDGTSPGPWPGVSTFQRDSDGQIYRVGKSQFGPGDDFCATWPLLDLLQDGANGWEPKYFYGER